MDCKKTLEWVRNRWDICGKKEANLALSFGFGVISSIFGSYGYIFILSYIAYEIIVMIVGWNKYCLFDRVGIVFAAIMGWILGRTLSGCDCIWNDIE